MDAIDLNEAGLCAIDNEDYLLAVSLYRDAVFRINDERSRSPRTVTAAVDHRPCPYRVLPIALELDNEKVFTETTSSQDGHFVLYDVAFLMDYADVWQAYPFAMTTIIYNMALALHMDGLKKPSHVRLEQAKNMYEKALDYFTSIGRSFAQDMRYGDCQFLSFALCNNYGHCCSLLSDGNGLSRAQTYLSTLMAAPDCLTVLPEKEQTFFRASFMIGLLKASLSTVSPAA